ncbi:MAG: ATP-dependent Clp protease ATP-binding subunit [Actinobacteria bacterium]|nr:ATP-dependent Clp protease ATP-binding subunit [Actinomycetota bacterium]MBV8958101.1 ATP-dependent Clp protease ATP-binding subunit [Actinomycetota bacterium]MBV9253432.1 ATP-dependent Clp protease ATP-binding subunit [Actinomycetota bacterium]MBV9933499.1 ATP-dependent Clp protease ATP-binding subunit [Actinomycetota bacterium]
MADLPLTLEELVRKVEERTDHHGDPLGRLGAAVAMAADLDALGDNLVGHFVDEARAAGLPWSQIGTALGVTKQAAQQRFVPRDLTDAVLTRYTPRAQTVLNEATTAARTHKHNYIGTEHIALGLCHDPQTLAAVALEALGTSVDALRTAIEARLGPPSADAPPVPVFTPRAAKVLELTMREALRLGHNYIGTEHMLIALASYEGLGGDVLRELGATEEKVRAEVMKVLSAYMVKRAGGNA